jgi:hypothetical protein
VELQPLGRETTVVAQVEQRAPTEDPVVVVVRAQSVAPVRTTPVVPVVPVASPRLQEFLDSMLPVVVVPVALVVLVVALLAEQVQPQPVAGRLVLTTPVPAVVETSHLETTQPWVEMVDLVL